MNAGDLVMTAEHLSVKFCKDLKRSLWYGAKDIARELSGRAAPEPLLREQEIWALRDASLSLRRGECLGVVGPNGAGKSTLLRVLSGIFKPDGGRIAIRGRTGALLELGTGFNTTLSGRENVYINGVVLGMTRREIDRKFDEIIDFSEIGPFIDSPVKSYSSGMALRLAFSVAMQMEPDLLLIDEILAVGDVGFRAKCYLRMERLLSRCAVVFVSHSMSQVARLSTSLMVLDRGQVVYQGRDVPRGVEKYYSLFGKSGSTAGIGEGARIESLRVEGSAGLPPTADGTPRLGCREPLTLTLDAAISAPGRRTRFSLLFHDRETRGIAQLNMKLTAFSGAGRQRARATLPGGVPFNPGRYLIAVSVLDADTGEILHTQHNAAEFQLDGEFFGQTPVQLDGEWEILDENGHVD